jgi:hypothetical protein
VLQADKRDVTEGYGTLADPFTGEPVIVSVWISGRDSMIFGTLKEFQPRCLLVVAAMPDGHRLAKFVDIPNRHESKFVSVTIP